jgi:PAS domain S-box-containing protein
MFIHDADWRAEVEGAVEFLSLIDPDDRLLYVNHVQPGVNDHVGRPVFEFISPEHHDVARRAIDAVRTTGFPQHYESEAIGLGGGTSLYSNWIFPISNPEAAGAVAFVATDISSLRRIEGELARSDVTLRSLLEHAPDHILIVDRERRLLFVNRLELGFEPEDVMGLTVENSVAEADRELVISEIEAVIRTGERRSYETSVKAPNGEFRFLTRLGPIFVDGRVDGVVMISTDITQRRIAEQERERLNAELRHAQRIEALGQLTGGVAHDFNNLLTAIGGNLELLRAEVAPDHRGAAYLNEALRAVDLAADLTRRLLVFARKQPLAATTERIDELIDDMIPLLRRTLGETIDVRAVSVDHPWAAEIDRGQLEQALLNLALNARDAMPSGGRLEIVTENVVVDDHNEPIEQLPAGDYVSVTVRDSGIGMDVDVVDQAFEPFFTTKETGRGTGLGLSMVYGFVSQSGGHASLTSEPGRGTTVRLFLPRTEHADPRPEVAERDAARGTGQLVLVVEDQHIVRQLCVQLLIGLGYRTLEADDASEALSVLTAHPETALVLTDVGLPGEMNGFELAVRIRKDEPPLPVVLMSGYADDVLTNTGVPDGVQFLPKPFKRAELADMVERALAPSAGHDS